jgi:hypothetical protein
VTPASQTGPVRADDNDAPGSMSNTTVFIDAECASHVDQRNDLFVGQPVQQGTGQVFVHARQDDITPFKVFRSYVISQMASERYDFRFKSQLRSVAGRNIDFPCAPCILHGSAQDAAYIGRLDKISIDDRDTPYAKVSKLAKHYGTCSAQADNADMEIAKYILTVFTKREVLS